MSVLDEHLIPSASEGESNVFFNKMKGDYYRYLAEFKSGNEKKEAADQSLKAYEIANTVAEAFHEAISELDNLNKESYNDCTLILQLLRDNLTLWTSEISEEGAEDANKTNGYAKASAGGDNAGVK